MASSSHNRQVTAIPGGSSAIQTPANSGGGLFGDTRLGATHNASSVTTELNHKSTSMDEGKKRASQESGSVFGNLSNLKRDSQDPGTSKRKASMGEQGAQSGMIGTMWNNFTKGS